MIQVAILDVKHGGLYDADMSKWSVGGMKNLDGTYRPSMQGEAARDFMTQFDYVLTWDWPSIFMVNVMATYKTWMVPFLEIDAIKTYKEWSPLNERLRKTLMDRYGGRLLGPHSNRFGQPYVDLYEESGGNWNKKPHVWTIDLSNRFARELYLNELYAIHGLYETKPAAVAIDSVNGWNPSRYPGTASNMPDGQTNPPWMYWIRPIEQSICPVWQHSGGLIGLTPFCVAEHSLRDNDEAGIAALIQDARARQVNLCLAPNSGQSDVDKLRTLAETGLTPVGFQVARSGGFYAPISSFLV